MRGFKTQMKLLPFRTNTGNRAKYESVPEENKTYFTRKKGRWMKIKLVMTQPGNWSSNSNEVYSNGS